MKSDLSGKTTLTLDIREDLIIWGRRSELIQVFLNFLINAVQAMPDDRKANLIRVGAETEHGMTKITIEDNAKGIAREDLDQIFDPFFSSKPIGEGTGLGLSVSKGIIEAHQGSIEAISREGVGTIFTIRLPVIESALPKMIAQDLKHRASLESAARVTSAHEDLKSMITQDIDHYSKYKILIVDDDVLVSKSFKKMLNRYHTSVENSSVDVLDRLHYETFDLILSDVMMPELNGIELYWRVVKDHERYLNRFIFITGAAKSNRINEELSSTGRVILRKPITKPDLLDTIQHSLDQLS
jgi:CheY-like chemotaxis protein